MNSKILFITWLALFTLAAARPKSKLLNLGTESDPETKIREKRKYEIPLIWQLEESGVGVKRETPQQVAAAEAKAKAKEGASTGAPPKAEEGDEGDEGGESGEGDGGAPEEAALEEVLRVKKQSPNNVCIKVGGCGKTVCGPIVSARGPVLGDMRGMMLQGSKPVMALEDLHSAAVNDMTEVSSKLDKFSPLQGRTVDTIVAPVALGTLGYGSPAAYSAPAPAVDLAHSFFKPPSVPAAVPAVAVIAAPHQPSHSLVHPWLLPHLMPHLVPHLVPSLMSNIGSYFAPHRLEPTRFPEPIPTEIKQPVPAFPQPYSYGASGDNAMLCHPVRSQRFENSYDFFYKPEVAGDKSINVTDGTKKSQSDMNGEEERRIHEHLRRVNEIKDEISQLNRAAQRIVDQQERLTAMHQKQLWGSSGQSGAQSLHQTSGPYMGSGYYDHPAVPWGYSRSNILSYPRSQEDIEFFINLLRAGKKMGLLSDVVQPSVLSTIGEVFKGGQEGVKSQKDSTDGVLLQSDEKKTGKPEKKSIK